MFGVFFRFFFYLSVCDRLSNRNDVLRHIKEFRDILNRQYLDSKDLSHRYLGKESCLYLAVYGE